MKHSAGRPRAWGFGVLVFCGALLVGACTTDKVTSPDQSTSPGSTPALPRSAPSNKPAFNLIVPGSCTFSIGVTNQHTGLQNDTTTLCSFPDSAVVRISIVGTLTATIDPNYSCCFSTANAPNAGSYGPMGGRRFTQLATTFGAPSASLWQWNIFYRVRIPTVLIRK
ncbi:MAG: hypothetical protein ABJC26_05000 [Gemmatimonadaceae bacterium]